MNKIYPLFLLVKSLRFKRIFLFSLILFSCFSGAFAQKQINLSPNEEKYDLSFQQIEVFEDPSEKLTFEEILNKNFYPSSQKNINSGYSGGKFWYRIKVKNVSSKRWIYVIFGTLVDEIYLYEIKNDGSLRKRITGDLLPHSTREINSAFFAFYLDIPQNQSEILYLCVRSQDTKQFSLHIEDIEYFNKTMNSEMFKWFFYFGMIFMMLVYNLLLFFSVKDRTYLYYVLYLFNFGLFQFTIFGFGTQFMWGENIWFTNRASAIFGGGTTIFISLFSYKFLNLDFFFPKLKFIKNYLVASGFFMIAINLHHPTFMTNYIIAILSLINILAMVIMGILIVMKGYRPARYYMLAWGVLFLSFAIFVLNVSRILPNENISYLILPFGGAVEVIMLSFGLGNRINTIEKEKTNAQKEVVKQLRNNEEVRTRIARDLHDDLGSTLSSIRILSELAENQTINNSGKLPNLLNRIKNSTQKLQENLQDIVWTTQTKDNSIEQLLVKMRLFGGEILEAKNIEYFFKIDKNIHTVSIHSNIQYDVFMIFKEAINNIVKYANAQNVWVEICQKDDIITLSIKDDGIGFDTSQEIEGNGLKNMPRRAENILAKFDIRSKIGEGTTVSLTLPVPI
jgi:signal transduction histidine kinase